MKQKHSKEQPLSAYTNFSLILSCFLIITTLVAFFASSRVSAEGDPNGDGNGTSPTPCSLSSTGTDSHSAEIIKGGTNSEIGTTTLTVVCDDTEGFAIYAIGYTDDIYGKTVLSNPLDPSHNIATGTNTTGDSSWAIKLAADTDSSQAYPISIENSFDSFHTIPDDFTMVAKRTSATDIEQFTPEATLTATYQVHISPRQAIGTYSGAVRYVLVHPNNADTPVGDNRIAVNYHSNSSYFDQAKTKDTNKVIYETRYEDEYAYVGEPVIMRTSNLDDEGNQDGSYYDGSSYYDYLPVNGSVNFDGADRIRLEITYGLGEEASIGASIGGENVCSMYGCGDITNMDDSSINRSGTVTFVKEGSTAEVWLSTWSAPDPDYDYGVYVKAYPIYNNPTEGASYDVAEKDVLHLVASSGAYSEPINWDNKWYIEENGYKRWFNNEDEIINYLKENIPDILDTSIDIYSYYTYKIFYNGNNATRGTMNGISTELEQIDDSIDLTAYNFYKAGYGFAGWSEDPNATVNSQAKIYGPNEAIFGTDLSYDDAHQATLYAVWVPNSGTLQSWDGCSTLSTNQVIALSDERDDQTYAVAKLADDKCWIIENLRLESANSSDSTKAQGFGGAFVGLATAETNHFYDDTTANSLYSTSNITPGGSGYYQGYRFPRYNNNNTKAPDSGITSTDANIFGYGNYYSWAAAKANTTNFTQPSAATAANTSICPAGWELPESNSFSYLNGKISIGPNPNNSIIRLRTYPNNFVFSGQITNRSAIYSRGIGGYYWTSAISSGMSATSYIFSSNYGINNGMQKYNGQAVRCYQ